MMAGLLGVLLACATFQLAVSFNITLVNDQRHFNLQATANGIKLSAGIDNNVKLTGILWQGKDFRNYHCVGQASCIIGDSALKVTAITDGYRVTWETKNTHEVFSDCFDLGQGVNWYGGPQRAHQIWPIETMKIENNSPYVPRRYDNFAVCERYWLNSKGAYIFLKDNVPLYVDQNNHHANQVCFIASISGQYLGRTRNILEYDVILHNEPKTAHLHAVNHYLGKPSGRPETRMFENPIWTTWAKYKKAIDDNVVRQFAKSIRDHGFEAGQLEIDDEWERCYGAQEFSTQKFGHISDTVKYLHSLGFKVTLWIHPFVNDDCQGNSGEGSSKGYFVRDKTGNTIASWWDGNRAHQIDFTKPQAAEWFSARLRKIKNDHGVDAFKFDAGETDYAPQPAVYNVNIETVPMALSSSYVRTCAKFGGLIEVRSAWRTQDLPVFVRMIDKDSSWGIANGLRTLITTLLQMNINGYTMVLPDMIGGNGYGAKPDTELLIRWTQANTFMPAMQFSYLPWDFPGANTTDIVKKFVNLHKAHVNDIIKAMDDSIKNGVPVNAPIWWIDPTDQNALKCADEFLLGTNILVAPVVDKGQTSRNVYLPRGVWVDGNDGTKHQGPTTLWNFPAPLHILPWFKKVG